jgi:cyclophilin family peptidyl-prolyl cis-trans isomerase
MRRTGDRSFARTATLVALVTLVVAACTGGASPATSPSAASAVPSGGASTTCPSSAPAPLPAGETRTATIGTELGEIVVSVEADLGPLAAGNFVALAECGFYVGTTFHRLVPGFVIQGGDPAGDGTGGPGYEFANDPVTVAYDRGVVAMANAGRDTNGSQFFIMLDAAPQLPPDYSVFGRVTSGMDVVDEIAAMPNSGEPGNAALDPVTMDSLTVTEP